MGLIDQIKYAKILYLADVLEDISEELYKRRQNMSDICRSIDSIVRDLRDTLTDKGGANPMIKEDRIQIKRLEMRRKLDVLMYAPIGDRESYEQNVRLQMEGELLHHIKDSKLIRVRKNMDDTGIPTFTASLIVGIEKDADIPRQEPQITFMDKLAKFLDEERHI